MQTAKIIAVVALALSVSACCGCRKSASALPLRGTEWKLTQLGGENVRSDNYRVTLAPDGSVSGIGDCNRFAGTYTENEGAIDIADNLVATRAFCLNQAREDKFFAMLRDADSFSIDGKRLMLIKSGEVLAIFDPATPASSDDGKSKKK